MESEKKLKKDWKQRFEEYNKAFKVCSKKNVEIQKKEEVKDENDK